MISLHLIYVWSPVRYTSNISIFVLFTTWSTVCKSSVSLQFCDHIQSNLHHIFTWMHSTVSIGDRHTWKVPQNPHNSPPPTPAPFKQRFPKFHCRTFSICCLHMFSSLESSYSLFEGLLSFGWPKDKRSSNRFWIDSPQVSFPFQRKFHPFSHTDTPSPKCAYSFSRSRCSSLNSVRAWTVLFIKNLFS